MPNEEKYQIVFLVKGLIAPRIEMNFNNTLSVKGIPDKNESTVSFGFNKDEKTTQKSFTSRLIYEEIGVCMH